MRTGLLGASAAMAMGAVAVASGLVPGVGGPFNDGPDRDRVQAEGPEGLNPPDGVPADPSPSDRRGGESSSRSGQRDGTPSTSAPPTGDRSTSPSPSESSPSGGNGQQGGEGSPRHEGSGSGTGGGSAEPESSGGTGAAEGTGGTGGEDAKEPDPDGQAQASDEEAAAEAEVLKLVNQERAKAGCQRVRADSDLAGLAADFSEDMAERDFFSHTTPDGLSPWDRAENSGISNLGGENIARGQANARSVMDSWMNSPGHKANILNCDYRTLGVGAHFDEGGPWWTQDFGF